MRTLAFLFLFGAAGITTAADDKKDVKAGDTRVFEMRTYYAAPGKMKDLQARFRDHTCKLFEKHGITNIGYWTPAVNPKAEQTRETEEKLVYILAYPSKEAADKSWKAFRDDPDWKAAQKKSEENGKLVSKVESVYMNPTDYSPLK